MQAAVTVSKDLEVNVYQLQNIAPQSLYSHILESRKVKLHSQITNLLTFAKNLETNKTAMEDIFKSSYMQLVNKEMEISENNSLCRFLKLSSSSSYLFIYQVTSYHKKKLQLPLGISPKHRNKQFL